MVGGGRKGSGSACRSLYGGFARWNMGQVGGLFPPLFLGNAPSPPPLHRHVLTDERDLGCGWGVGCDENGFFFFFFSPPLDIFFSEFLLALKPSSSCVSIRQLILVFWVLKFCVPSSHLRHPLETQHPMPKWWNRPFLDTYSREFIFK